ncbi:hypothetical protein HELRODRAFT_166668 [Helobdella robusta]|uniref:Uncharacterized protein n=1 Tax=Helobdella robusta TaxID=6412 RepID=T1EYC1_HELRO|nr:hypothetical protein HELRODRAFT_166668 [Helobdella robusta]ESO11654.1 hypothetical protein HELRODRAFT_166668 [Helobdella robusta]
MIKSKPLGKFTERLTIVTMVTLMCMTSLSGEQVTFVSHDEVGTSGGDNKELSPPTPVTPIPVPPIPFPPTTVPPVPDPPIISRPLEISTNQKRPDTDPDTGVASADLLSTEVFICATVLLCCIIVAIVCAIWTVDYISRIGNFTFEV